jgi:predicted transcriptional regulator
MKNYEIIERLKSDGFCISHATFYRYKKMKLFGTAATYSEIKKAVLKVDKLKSKTIKDLTK